MALRRGNGKALTHQEARIARLIADEPEVASVDHDDLRTALASVRNGSTFTF